MPDEMHLRLGEERALHVPADAAPWTVHVSGMTSAVDVRKLWAADPYPKDDDEDEQAERPPPDVVFMVRAVSPGDATIRFVRADGGEPRAVGVKVSM